MGPRSSGREHGTTAEIIGATAAILAIVVAVVFGVAQCSNGSGTEQTATAESSSTVSSIMSSSSTGASSTAATTTAGTTTASTTPSTTTGTTTSSATGSPVPRSQFVADLRPKKGNPSTGSVEVDGTTYTHALSRQLSGCQRDSAWPFDIGRDWTWFTTTVGVSDKSDFDVAVRFEIYADGNLVRTADVSFGEADTLTVPVTGVLELELRSTFVKGNMGLCSSAGYAVWGDPTLRR